MHLLSVFSLRNRALIALLTIVVGIFGTVALTTLKQELFPSVTLPQLVVVTQYPGASLVTGPAPAGQITINQMYVQYRIPAAKTGVPIVMAPFMASFMLPVPEASVPAVEICSERSAPGMMTSATDTP